MAFDGLFSALAAVIPALFLAAGVYIYVALVRQIGTRVADPTAPLAREFGWPEATLATFLVLLFVGLFVFAPHDVNRAQNPDLAGGAIFSIGLLIFIAGFLWLRGFDLNSLGGFSKIGFGRAAGFCSWPPTRWFFSRRW
jgi:protein-S-isoprenylcysteine O-methyltransferase Ste14